MSDRDWLDPLVRSLKVLDRDGAGGEPALAEAVLAVLAEHRAIYAIAPASLGGLGIAPLTACRAVAAAASVSGSAGLAFAMHLAQLATVLKHGGGAVARLGEWARGSGLLASGTSEVGTGGDILQSRCRIEPAETGWRVTKQLANVSYLDRADAILLTAIDARRGRSVQRLIVVERGRFTIEAARENRFFGMRGLRHQAVTLSCAVDDDAILAQPFSVVSRTMSAASHLYWAAAWCGLGRAAIDRAAGLATADPMLLEEASERLHLMQALVRDACDRDADASPDTMYGPAWRSSALKLSCSRLLGEVVATCSGAAGLAGYVEGGPADLSTIVRDSISAPIMVSNARLAAKNAHLRPLAAEEL